MIRHGERKNGKKIIPKTDPEKEKNKSCKCVEIKKNGKTKEFQTECIFVCLSLTQSLLSLFFMSLLSSQNPKSSLKYKAFITLAEKPIFFFKLGIGLTKSIVYTCSKNERN